MNKHIKTFLNRRLPYFDGVTRAAWVPNSVHFKNLRNAKILTCPEAKLFTPELLHRLIKNRETTLESVLNDIVIEKHYPMTNVILHTIEDSVPVFKHLCVQNDLAFIFYFMLHRSKKSNEWKKVFIRTQMIKIVNHEVMYKLVRGKGLSILNGPEHPEKDMYLQYFTADIVPLVVLYLSKQLNINIFDTNGESTHPGYKGELHKILNINPSAEQLENIVTCAGTSVKQRYHSVRGHLRTYKKSGKSIFIDEFHKGDKTIGEVIKDYKITSFSRLE